MNNLLSMAKYKQLIFYAYIIYDLVHFEQVGRKLHGELYYVNVISVVYVNYPTLLSCQVEASILSEFPSWMRTVCMIN